ncbi:uncharacterized protein DS421_16g538780 [Arachis hypogaea]|nr:uncharacterized protein DS421_16g538780 [Arachis hypogaea]
MGPHCRRRPAQRRRTLPVSLPPIIHATHSSNSCQTKQRKKEGTECGREKKERRRRVGAAGPHRHCRIVPPRSTPCCHRCTPKEERERDMESASRREGLAASSVVFTALPPSSSQSWREHSAAVSRDQKRARDQERGVESATRREALAAAVARAVGCCRCCLSSHHPLHSIALVCRRHCWRSARSALKERKRFRPPLLLAL